MQPSQNALQKLHKKLPIGNKKPFPKHGPHGPRCPLSAFLNCAKKKGKTELLFWVAFWVLCLTSKFSALLCCTQRSFHKLLDGQRSSHFSLFRLRGVVLVFLGQLLAFQFSMCSILSVFCALLTRIEAREVLGCRCWRVPMECSLPICRRQKRCLLIEHGGPCFPTLKRMHRRFGGCLAEHSPSCTTQRFNSASGPFACVECWVRRQQRKKKCSAS